MMLPYSFCFLGGLGREAERMLWQSGIYCWADYRRTKRRWFSASQHERIIADMDRAEQELALEKGLEGAKWFLSKLPAAECVRIYPHYRNSFLYLDVETTGLSQEDTITTLAVSQGGIRRIFVRNRNLTHARELFASKCIYVSYSGRSFDIPHLRREFRLPMRQPHLDLRLVLKARGITGGQKRAENLLGIVRTSSLGLTGKDAIILWQEYQRGDTDSLEKLCLYNMEDTIGLERILIGLYNESMSGHTFFSTVVQ